MLNVIHALTRDRNGNQYWFTNYGWFSGCCHHTNRYFVCTQNAGKQLVNTVFQMMYSLCIELSTENEILRYILIQIIVVFRIGEELYENGQYVVHNTW